MLLVGPYNKKRRQPHKGPDGVCIQHGLRIGFRDWVCRVRDKKAKAKVC